VSGHHRLAAFRQLAHETDPDAHRLGRIVVERVVPVGTVEMVLEHRIDGTKSSVPVLPGCEAVSKLMFVS
jgi:hypothetical protein